MVKDSPSVDAYVYVPSRVLGRKPVMAESRVVQLPMVQEAIGYVSSCSMPYAIKAFLIEFKLASFLASLAELIAPLSLAIAKPERMTMMLITTNSSIRVKALFLFI